MARPKFKKTRDAIDHVEYLARSGASERDISIAVQIDRKTLRRYFSAEIAGARVESRIEILKRIRDNAIHGHLPSAMALLKLLGGPEKKLKPTPPPAGAGQPQMMKDAEHDNE